MSRERRKSQKCGLRLFFAGSQFTNSSQKNWHSPLDSANNKCYITARTKEGEQKENKEISSMRFLIT